jgi:tetratricopeptide (TPR) repeat protein
LLATAGRALTAPELAALPLPDLDDAQRAALDTGLVRRAGGGLRFGHALVAETVRADLGEENWHHEQLAHAIETSASTPDAVAAEVAEHLHRAGPDDLAAPRWARAARYARSLGALDDAARFWTEAVRCTPGDVGSRLELVEVLGWLGQEDAFEREWRAALDYAAEDDRADVWSRRGKVLRTVVCHPSASLAAYRQAAELLPAAAPTRLRVEILFGIAWGESSAGDPARAEDVLDEIAALVPEPDDTTRAELANVRVMTLIRLGRFAECAAVAEEGGRAAARAARPDLAYPIWVHTACALSCAGNLAGALRVTEQAVAATRGTPALELPCLAAHAFVLSRLDRHDDAIALADEQLALAGRIDSPALAALARHDAGLIASAAGRYAEAVELLGAGLDAGAAVSRPAARLVRAEALARLGRVEEAAAEVRAAALEPVRAGDLPWALVPQLARVQGVVAQARGDRAEARRRLEEALGGWRRHVGHDAAAEFLRNFLDLGRPPIVGLVEPARELRRVEAELAALDQLTEVS